MVDENHGNTHFADAAFITAVRENGPIGTSDVATHVGCVTRTADQRLKELREAGTVASTMIGKSLVWTMNDGDSNE